MNSYREKIERVALESKDCRAEKFELARLRFEQACVALANCSTGEIDQQTLDDDEMIVISSFEGTAS